MKIGIGNDHRGYKLKINILDELSKKGYNVIDLGSIDENPTDYPIYAFKVGEAIAKHEIDFGILICRTGIGMSVACNKVKGVRCGKVDNKSEAQLCRIDNDCNVISLSYEKDLTEIMDYILTFINTNTSLDERHVRRRNMIKEYEEKC